VPTLEQLRKLLAAEPNDPFTLYAIAQAHASRGEHDQAVEFYDRCIGADAGHVYAYYHKARSLIALDRLDDARAAIQMGLNAARNARDAHACSELEDLLESLG
jgi:tetratricopeptide (TPR) repeat protein